MYSPLINSADDPRVRDPASGTDAYCDKKMQDIDDEFTGYKMYSDHATWEYVAWKYVKLDAIQDSRMTAANIDEYHHVETLKVKPGRNCLVGLGYTSPSPFSRQANTIAYISKKKDDLQGKYGLDMPGDSQDLDRAWDAVSSKFQGNAQTSEGDLDEHWLIELRKLRPDLVKHNPRPRAPPVSTVPTNTVGISSYTGKRRRDNWAKSEETAESGEAGSPSQRRAKKPRKTISPAIQKAVNSGTRDSSRLKSATRPKAQDNQAEQGVDDEQGDCTTAKPKESQKQGTGSKSKKMAPQLAWINKRFRVLNAETNKPTNWKMIMSLEFKKEYIILCLTRPTTP